MELGIRLKAVADLVLPTETIADIGCDHGYLSIYLYKNQICKKVIAMDVNQGPLARAEKRILRMGYGSYIERRLSNGLAKLGYKEADACVCAGMGGTLALRILWEGRKKVAQMQYVILQPQSEIDVVRRTLQKWKFTFAKEDIVKEDGKFYPMMRLIPNPQFDELYGEFETWISMGENRNETELLEEMYCLTLLKEKNLVLEEFLMKEKRRLKEVRLTLSQDEENVRCQERVREIKKEEILLDAALAFYEK